MNSHLTTRSASLVTAGLLAAGGVTAAVVASRSDGGRRPVAPGATAGPAPATSSVPPTAEPHPDVAPGAPVVVADCTHSRVRPTRITIACGDGNYYLRDLHYRSWTRWGAAARGLAMVNDCTPDCARGQFRPHHVDVRLDRPKVLHGRLTFTRAVVVDRTTHRVLRAPLVPLS